MASPYITYATINSLEEFGFIAGTDYEITFNVFEQDGVTPLDMGGATIYWVISPYGQSNYNVLQLNGLITGIGVFTVTVPSASTENLSGKFIHQPVIVSFAGGEYRPAQGVLLIVPRIPLN